MKTDKLFNLISEAAVALGAFKAKVISAKKMPLDRVFRDMCASNVCGM